LVWGEKELEKSTHSTKKDLENGANPQLMGDEEKKDEWRKEGGPF